MEQKSIASLHPTHAVALQEYLAKHRDFDFVPETTCDRESLKAMREQFGARFAPFGLAGQVVLSHEIMRRAYRACLTYPCEIDLLCKAGKFCMVFSNSQENIQ